MFLIFAAVIARAFWVLGLKFNPIHTKFCSPDRMNLKNVKENGA
jgi:hypothetical protein